MLQDQTILLLTYPLAFALAFVRHQPHLESSQPALQPSPNGTDSAMAKSIILHRRHYADSWRTVTEHLLCRPGHLSGWYIIRSELPPFLYPITFSSPFRNASIFFPGTRSELSKSTSNQMNFISLSPNSGRHSDKC